MPPTVSVIMPVYNGNKHLAEAIESILSQHFRDFEFLIMDDGSTDNSQDIVRSYHDRRIKLYRTEKNNGIANTLNSGISIAQGKYIARMDCDDISHPERLRAQVNFLEEHPEIGLLGTGVVKIKKKRNSKAVFWPSSDPEIKIDLLFQNPFFHPSIMARTDLLRKTRYDENQIYAQDYGLWVALASQTRFANLPATLLRYRTHEGQVTKTKGRQQALSARKIRQHYISELFPTITKTELAVHHQLSERNRTINLNDAKTWLEHFVELNYETKVFPDDLFRKIIARKWWNCCKNNQGNAKQLWHSYKASYLSAINTGEPRHAMKYLIKALFR
ncbi:MULTISPECIES: glycosyltransferase [unclassified Prosthecochloris]|uniref:glycosyltransferase family 2 protein n=1 Tax=unclassified Prosthecochloris TaxID=2632826 RepID=UPI00223D6E3E|nr:MULTISPECIES: glycosyltransferase [unclassified Prosthecochloris]UZJ39118.1 glycosyltransferase [Prosthecochloris sp. SCSIO W1102]